MKYTLNTKSVMDKQTNILSGMFLIPVVITFILTGISILSMSLLLMNVLLFASQFEEKLKKQKCRKDNKGVKKK